MAAGHVKDPFDPRDHYYIPDPSTQPPPYVNLREGNPDSTIRIYDQSTSNSCVANATAAAFWYEEKAGRHGETWGEQGPSRLFIYWLARGAYKSQWLDINHPYDSGTHAREAMKGVAKCGVCSESDWPFNLNNVNIRPPDKACEAATSHKITSFYRLDPDRPEEETHKLTLDQKDKMGAQVLANLKMCLAEHYPVVFGFWYYLAPSESFDESQRPFILKDVWSRPDRPFPRHVYQDDLPEELKPRDSSGQLLSVGGHTVLAIGYNDDRQQVLIQNSRGPNWGGSGTFWMPYSWITDCAATSDFWTIRSMPIAGAKRWDEVHQDVLDA